MTASYQPDHKSVLDRSRRLRHTRRMSTASIAPLPTPATPADLAQLIALLTACVHGGASMGFLAPLPPRDAEDYWTKIVAEHARGTRLLLVARDPATGHLVGSAQLAYESRPNGRHRAEVQKLMVLPGHRGRGLATRLMAHLEATARSRSLRLLFLDTSCGRGGATAFYTRLGYTLAGSIPDYAMDPDGPLAANAIFYKRLNA